MARERRLHVLRLQNADYIHTSIPLEKEEADLVRGLARARFGPGVAGKPQVGQAVAYLLRVAFNCFREHRDRYQDPTPLTASKALQDDLRTPYRETKLRTGRKDKRPGPARRRHV